MATLWAILLGREKQLTNVGRGRAGRTPPPLQHQHHPPPTTLIWAHHLSCDLLRINLNLNTVARRPGLGALVERGRRPAARTLRTTTTRRCVIRWRLLCRARPSSRTGICALGGTKRLFTSAAHKVGRKMDGEMMDFNIAPSQFEFGPARAR